MGLCKRIVPRPGTGRQLATRHRSGAAGAFLLSVVLMFTGRSIGDPGAAPDDRGHASPSAALAVSVSETPDAVRLRIQVSGEVEPGSLEVRFGGRNADVLARDAAGRTIRSQPVRLPAPVVEDGANADYDAEDALVMTFRKQAAAQAAGPPGDPESAAR